MRRLISTLILAVVFYTGTQAQVGIGTALPNASSMLDVTSTAKGFLPPRMTLAQRDAIASPATGLMVYQTDAPAGYYHYNGSAWVGIGFSPAYAHASTNGSTINLLTIATTIPISLAASQSSDITLNANKLKIGTAGTYQISYKLSTTVSLAMSARLLKNTTSITGTVSSGLVSLSEFSGSTIIDLAVDDEISLQFFGLIGVATFIGDNYLSIVRIK